MTNERHVMNLEPHYIPSKIKETDKTSFQAQAIIEAAIAWRWKLKDDSVFPREVWVLMEACSAYGDKYKGLAEAQDD